MHIHTIYIPPRSICSAGHSAYIAHILPNNEMSLTVRDINAHHSRWDKNTNEEERGEQLADEVDAADCTILSENDATRQPTNGRSAFPDNSLASNDIALLSEWPVSNSLASDHLPILITIITDPRLTGFGEPTLPSRKRTGHVMLNATNTWLKLAKQELSNKPRRHSGKQLIKPVASSFRRPHSILQTIPAGISQIALPRTRPKMLTKSHRRNDQRSKLTDTNTGGRRQPNQMAIRR